MSANAALSEHPAEDLAEDEAAFEAAMRGDYVTHKAVARWLESKATPTPQPRPDFGE